MTTLLSALVLLGLGFVAGAVYEAVRKDGSQDAWAIVNGRPVNK